MIAADKLAGMSKGRTRLMEAAIKKADAFDVELASTLSEFEAWRCQPIQGGGGLYGKETQIPEYHPVHPFLSAKVREEIALLPPQEPIKLPKGSHLFIEEWDMSFKSPMGISIRMQKNIAVLDLRLNLDGFLYSPKAYNPDWNWQTQAIWFRLIGMGQIAIAKRLDVPHRTVTKMFTRIKQMTKYYPRISKVDFATIGVIKGESGTKEIRFGGVSREGILGSEDEFINQMTAKSQPATGTFSLEEHKKAIEAREAQAAIDKLASVDEQARLTKEARCRNNWKPKEDE